MDVPNRTWVSMFNKLQLNTAPAKFLAKSCSDKTAMLVLFKCMYLVNKANMIVGSPPVIAQRAGITMRDFSLGVRGLKKANLIRKHTKREYMVNPDIVFNGDDRQYYAVKYVWDKQTTRGLRDG